MARRQKAKEAQAAAEAAEERAGLEARKAAKAEADAAASEAAAAERQAAEADASSVGEACSIVVLRPGWTHDPYRGAGGIVIPSATPTEVTEEQATYLLTTFPDAFTVQK